MSGPTVLGKRFWSKVDQSGDCWVWIGTRNANGYGRYSIGYKRYQAHRLAYEAAVGPIPDGLVIDHLCRNRGCVKPSHLEVVTQRENVLRGATLPARQLAQTHCKREHPLTGTNIMLINGERRCRQCHSERLHRAYWRDPEKRRAEDRARYWRTKGIDKLREVPTDG